MELKELNISDEELKEEFIKYFGEEKWIEEEALAILWPIELDLAIYFNIEPIPVIVEDIDSESLYDKELNYIAISKKIILNKEKAIKNLIKQFINYQKTINADS